MRMRNGSRGQYRPSCFARTLVKRSGLPGARQWHCCYSPSRKSVSTTPLPRNPAARYKFLSLRALTDINRWSDGLVILTRWAWGKTQPSTRIRLTSNTGLLGAPNDVRPTGLKRSPILTPRFQAIISFGEKLAAGFNLTVIGPPLHACITANVVSMSGHRF